MSVEASLDDEDPVRDGRCQMRDVRRSAAGLTGGQGFIESAEES
jgi:hypothetical protein